MKVLLILSLLVIVVNAQQQMENYPPIPYSFNYVSTGEDGGTSARQEEGDGNGRVQGTYTVDDLEGHKRVVEYVADENGFRAIVKTNEPGTIDSKPADVTYESSAEGARHQ